MELIHLIIIIARLPHYFCPSSSEAGVSGCTVAEDDLEAMPRVVALEPRACSG